MYPDIVCKGRCFLRFSRPSKRRRFLRRSPEEIFEIGGICVKGRKRRFLKNGEKISGYVYTEPKRPGGGVLPYMGYIVGSPSLNRVSCLTLLFLCPWCGP